ncbi:hypothetical protein OA40_16390 [Morganella morganii]|uniref:replicative DNA helicase n=1 Tax=Morganella morganii TaxID=582 RepID=UPI00062C71BA|nr:replicative DNA helicase [Morganella morganii]KKY64229.1 hypothetical protein OA40_16390 [Morganella morganii]
MFSEQELEAAVIGGLLAGGATQDAYDVLATLPDDAFSVGYFSRVYREIKKQALTSAIIDPVFIADALGGNGDFAHIMELTRKTISYANLKGYAEKVRNYAAVRKITALINKFQKEIIDAATHDQAESVIQKFSSEFTLITSEKESLVPVHISNLLDGYVDILDKRTRGEDSGMIVRTGIEAIDNKIGGFNPTDLIFIGGRPGMGKTELALTMMEGMAAKGDGVLMFSMEMANMQIVERMISGAARLPASKLRNCDLDDEEWQRVIASTGYLQDRDIHIIDASNLTIDQICAISERHKRKYPATKGIFIDYLGLIKKPKAERNDLAIAAISAGMKALAKRLHTPVVALSQLSRDVDKRPLNQRRPVAADLRDSGSLEQDADYIFLTYRDAVYNPNSPAKNYAEIIIEKNRYGETGTVYQEFKNGHYLPTDQISAAEVSRMQQQAEAPKSRRYADKAF